MNNSLPKVAFVVQRCGDSVVGGAEFLCLNLARRMSERWNIEILTTCAADHYTWENSYPEGVHVEDGLIIRRFLVDTPRDRKSFHRLSQKLNRKRWLLPLSIVEQEAWMQAQGPWASTLESFILGNKDTYFAFLFFTYLYATTYFLLPCVKEKAWLVPCGHDEWAIKFSMWDAFFNLPKGYIFLTVEERDFLKKRFPRAALNGPVSGIGVEPPPLVRGENFRDAYNLSAPFLLYCGRVDQNKGCADLVKYFLRFKKQHPSDLKLVLLGKGEIHISAHPDILRCGFVDEETKWNALAACDWLVNPSPHESLSIVILEAWAVSKPVLINEACSVLVGHCARSNGGLSFKNYKDFAKILLSVNAKEREKMGVNGNVYVRDNYAWNKIIEIYGSTVKK